MFITEREHCMRWMTKKTGLVIDVGEGWKDVEL
jgi:hypothetical protein